MSRHRGRSNNVQGNTSTHRTGQTIHRSSRNVSTNPRRSTHPNTGNTRQKSQNNNHRNQSTRRANPTQPTTNNARHNSQNARRRQNPRNNSQNGPRRRQNSRNNTGRTVTDEKGKRVSKQFLQRRVKKQKGILKDEIDVGFKICAYFREKTSLFEPSKSLAFIDEIESKLEEYRGFLTTARTGPPRRTFFLRKGMRKEFKKRRCTADFHVLFVVLKRNTNRRPHWSLLHMLRNCHRMLCSARNMCCIHENILNCLTFYTFISLVTGRQHF